MNPTDPAFPCYVPGYTDKHGTGGMDLRTYVATHCAAAMLTNGPWSSQEVADHAVKQTDALIARLNAK